jgi:hypothetical protein
MVGIMLLRRSRDDGDARPMRVGQAVLVMVLLMLAAPAAADARFVVNQSMAGVHLGMTGKQVRARLGAPDEVTRHGRTRNLVYRSRKMFVTLVGGKVHILSTDGRGQRGPGRVGVGTRERRLRRVLPMADCESAEGVRTCSLGGFDLGEISTVFVMRKRRVSTVTITKAF